MNSRTPIRRISAKRLAELEGKIPFSTIRPRLRFPRKGKPRSTRGGFKLRKGILCQNATAKGGPIRGNSLGKIQETAAAGHKAGRRKAISRVGKHWLNKPAVIFRGEREICNPATDEGRTEYKWRTILMVVRQNGWCCFHEYEFCPGRLKLKDSTFEHEGKRTKGQQDDRISYFDAAGKEQPLNGAAHGECNGIAGSRKLPIDHGTNCIYEEKSHATQ